MIRRFLHFVVSKPVIYDQIQSLLGRRKVDLFIKSYVTDVSGKVVLDVGAGTGLTTRILPAETALYIALDIDPQKLAGFHSNLLRTTVVAADATQLPLQDQSVDYTLCLAVTHHLSDNQLTRLFSELARVTREKMLLLDAIQTPRVISKMLWYYDRGSYPRSAQTLQQSIQKFFDLKTTDYLTIFHHYMLCVCRSKNSLS